MEDKIYLEETIRDLEGERLNEVVNPLSDIIMYKEQDRMAELFGVQRPAITKYLSNIFKSGELQEKAVCSILERTVLDGKRYKVKYYFFYTKRSSDLKSIKEDAVGENFGGAYDGI